MNTLKLFVFAFSFTAFFLSCQSKSEVKEVLEKSVTRKEIMATIANDSSMHKEMMDAMMDGKNENMMMKNHTATIKDNPAMMDDMMEMCKTDTGMCKTMMDKTMQMCDMDKSKCSMMVEAMQHHANGTKTMKDMGMCNIPAINMGTKKHIH